MGGREPKFKQEGKGLMASQHVFQESAKGRHTLKLRPQPCGGQVGNQVQHGTCGGIGDNYIIAGVMLTTCRKANGDGDGDGDDARLKIARPKCLMADSLADLGTRLTDVAPGLALQAVRLNQSPQVF
jgi:hypothetical protein